MGPSGESNAHRPGNETPHWRERIFLIFMDGEVEQPHLAFSANIYKSSYTSYGTLSTTYVILFQYIDKVQSANLFCSLFPAFSDLNYDLNYKKNLSFLCVCLAPLNL